MERDDDAPATPPPLPGTGSNDRAAPPQRRSFWRRPIGILTAIGLGFGALLFLAVVGFGVATMTGYLPDTKAVAGDRLGDHVISVLRDAEIIESDEEVKDHYGAGVLSFLEDGNLFTDRRVISYWQAEGELQVDSATYDEIAEISVSWSDSWLEDTEITVKLADGDELLLYVSNEDGGDRKFHTALERLWQQSKK